MANDDFSGLVGIDTAYVKADLDQLGFQIDQMTGELRRELESVESTLGAEVVARAQGYASGEVLAVRSGRFLGSIHDAVSDTGTGVATTISSDDPIAGVLEYGAMVPAHEIDPQTARALHFLTRDGYAFAARVQWPGAKIPPHPTIHRAFAELEPEIYERMIDVIEANVSLGAALDPTGSDLEAFVPFARFVPGGTSFLGAAIKDIAAL